MKLRNVILGVGCWLAVGGATAISLGQGRGSVLLGAPVDLAFDVQPDAGSDIASSCVTADVAFGDSSVGDARIRVSPLPDLPGRSPAVRVQVAGSVNEPVITVTVSAGCSGKVTRTYTFLADLPGAQPPGRVVNIDQMASVPPVPARISGAGADRPASAPTLRRPAQPSEQREEAAPPPRLPQAAIPPARVAPSRVPAVVARKAPEAKERTTKAAASAARPERARLVMEPLDALSEPAVALRLSTDMAPMPAQASASQRLQAAAVWKAMNTPLEAVQRDDERVRALEAEMAALRAKSTAERASVVDLEQRLASIESQRFSAGGVYALMALLVFVLGLLAWVWSRARRESGLAIQAWRNSVAVNARHGDGDRVDPHDLTLHPHDTWAPEDSTPPVQDTYTQPPAQQPSRVVVAPVAATLRAPVPKAEPTAATAHLIEDPAHIVNPEELFDIQQQAEFFVSVGEHDQAVGVLKKHIAAHGETSPSAYLELLRLYHTLGRSDDFAQLREQFCHHFNAQVPEFSAFSRQGKNLEHYVDALATIEADWTVPSVIPLLEKLLFRRTGDAAVAPFDLIAYDDLLLLWAIAQTTPASARGLPPPRMRTTPLALPRDGAESGLSDRQPSAVVRPAADQPLDSLAASLEFDFGHHTPAVEPSGSKATLPRAPLNIQELDLDLSDPPHLTISDLPPVPVTVAPRADQPVGFGMANDLVEARLELEPRMPDPKA